MTVKASGKKPKGRFRWLYSLLVIGVGVCLGCGALAAAVSDRDTGPEATQRQTGAGQVFTPAETPALTVEPSLTPATMPTAEPSPAPSPSPAPEQADTADDAALRAEAETVLAELTQYLEAGRQMELLRVPDDTDKMAACGQQMRGNQSEVEALGDRAGELPLAYVLLGSAAINLNRCVSCVPDALAYCDLAEADLADFKKWFGE